RGRNSHGDKTDDAKDGKECESRSNPEPFQQTSRQENLHEHGKEIYPDIEAREKDSPCGAIVKLVPGDIGQLKINKRSRDRVEEHKRDHDYVYLFSTGRCHRAPISRSRRTDYLFRAPRCLGKFPYRARANFPDGTFAEMVRGWTDSRIPSRP